jgi:hypothetical protein
MKAIMAVPAKATTTIVIAVAKTLTMRAIRAASAGRRAATRHRSARHTTVILAGGAVNTRASITSPIRTITPPACVRNLVRIQLRRHTRRRIQLRRHTPRRILALAQLLVPVPILVLVRILGLALVPIPALARIRGLVLVPILALARILGPALAHTRGPALVRVRGLVPTGITVAGTTTGTARGTTVRSAGGAAL